MKAKWDQNSLVNDFLAKKGQDVLLGFLCIYSFSNCDINEVTDLNNTVTIIWETLCVAILRGECLDNGSIRKDIE